MHGINWPVIVGISFAATILIVGVALAIWQGAFRTPGRRTNIANVYTDESIKLVRQQWRDECKRLADDHQVLEQQCKKHSKKLLETQNKLTETRLALKLLTKTAGESVTILEAVSVDEASVVKLAKALHVVQKILDRS